MPNNIRNCYGNGPLQYLRLHSRHMHGVGLHAASHIHDTDARHRRNRSTNISANGPRGRVFRSTGIGKRSGKLAVGGYEPHHHHLLGNRIRYQDVQRPFPPQITALPSKRQPGTAGYLPETFLKTISASITADSEAPFGASFGFHATTNLQSVNGNGKRGKEGCGFSPNNC